MFGRRKEQKYYDLRQAAYRASEARLAQLIAEAKPDRAGMTAGLQSIDAVALKAWDDAWRPHLQPGIDGHNWNWRQTCAAYKNDWDRFEVAVWSGGSLCGLSIGKPSNSRRYLAVNLLQGCPVLNHPLKGVIRHIVIDTAIAYAGELNIKELRLVNPTPGALPLYQRLNFHLAQPGGELPYCFLRL